MYYSATTKNDIIACLARDKALIRELRVVCRTSNIDDLMQEIYGFLLAKKDELILGLNTRNEIKFYVIRMVISQYWSTSSKFFTTYKKPARMLTSLDNEEEDTLLGNYIQDFSNKEFLSEMLESETQENNKEKLLFILEEIKHLDWYTREIFLMYTTQDTTYTKLSSKLGIPRISLFNTVKAAKLQILARWKA